jgi:hypothetical protein
MYVVYNNVFIITSVSSITLLIISTVTESSTVEAIIPYSKHMKFMELRTNFPTDCLNQSYWNLISAW